MSGRISQVTLDVVLDTGDELEVDLMNIPVEGGITAENITGESIKALHLVQLVQDVVEEHPDYVDGTVEDMDVTYARD
ncbi:MAG: hypothetical protein AAGA18_13960 [Verrucomicrobiota bacterium]